MSKHNFSSAANCLYSTPVLPEEHTLLIKLTSAIEGLPVAKVKNGTRI